MAEVSVINVTSLTPIVAAAIVSGQQVTIYDNGGIAYRAPIEDVVSAAQGLNNCLCIKQATLTIPTAQVLTAFSAPVAFGLTVPAGYYVNPMQIQVYVDFNSIAYATNTSLYVGAIGATVNIAVNSNVLAATTSKIALIPIITTPSSGQVQYVSGADLEVYVGVGNPTAGDSDITIVLTYVLIPTP